MFVVFLMGCGVLVIVILIFVVWSIVILLKLLLNVSVLVGVIWLFCNNFINVVVLVMFVVMIFK